MNTQESFNKTCIIMVIVAVLCCDDIEFISGNI